MVLLGMRHKEFRLINTRKQHEENKNFAEQLLRETKYKIKQWEIIQSRDPVY